MALQDKLDAIRSKFETRIDPETRIAMEVAMRHPSLSGIRRTALSAGAMAPLFDLAAVSGGRVHLAGLLRRGPVVISFHHGDCASILAENSPYEPGASTLTDAVRSISSLSDDHKESIR